MVVPMMLHRMQRPDVCSKHVLTGTASMAVRRQVFLPASPLLAFLAHVVPEIVFAGDAVGVDASNTVSDAAEREGDVGDARPRVVQDRMVT